MIVEANYFVVHREMNAFLVVCEGKEYALELSLCMHESAKYMPSVKWSIMNNCTSKPTYIYSLNGNGTQQNQ